MKKVIKGNKVKAKNDLLKRPAGNDTKGVNMKDRRDFKKALGKAPEEIQNHMQKLYTLGYPSFEKRRLL